MRSWAWRAVSGGIVWAAYLTVASTSGTAGSEAGVIVLLGCLVLAPLALAVVEPSGGRGRWAVVRAMQMPCALALCGSFLLDPGGAAGLLSLPWFLFTGLVGMLGVLRFVERGGGPVGELAVDAGLVFLVVGGVWTAASRFGVPLLGFDEPWVILTAAHFHFAGLVLPIVTGRVARLEGGGLGTLASIGVIAGVPVVAAGITAGARGLPMIEWVAALGLMTAAVLSATMLVTVAFRTMTGAPRLLLCVAGVSLLAAMALVGIYATGEWTGASWLDIPVMVRTHGVLNAAGFALPALVALGTSRRQERHEGMEVLIPLLGDVPAEGLWESRELGQGWQLAAVADVHERRLPDELPGSPVADGPFRRAADAIMRYEAFPPGSLRGIVPRVPVRVDDTLRARFRFLPGVELVIAARVSAVFDEERDGVHRKGFSYGTLAGHPIGGEETFAVEKELRTGKVVARISSRSAMSNGLARATRPLVRWLQVRAGRAGVRYLGERAER